MYDLAAFSTFTGLLTTIQAGISPWSPGPGVSPQTPLLLPQLSQWSHGSGQFFHMDVAGVVSSAWLLSQVHPLLCMSQCGAWGTGCTPSADGAVCFLLGTSVPHATLGLAGSHGPNTCSRHPWVSSGRGTEGFVCPEDQSALPKAVGLRFIQCSPALPLSWAPTGPLLHPAPPKYPQEVGILCLLCMCMCMSGSPQCPVVRQTGPAEPWVWMRPAWAAQHSGLGATVRTW